MMAIEGFFKDLFKKRKDIRIRKAVNSDVFEIIQLIKEVRLAYGLDVDLKKKDRDLLNIQEFYKNGSFLVAEEDGKIVGCGSLVVDGNDTASIQKLYINKRFRRLGVGGEIALMLIQYAKLRACHQIFISSSKKMKMGHRFIKSLGFDTYELAVPESRQSVKRFIMDLRH